MNALWPADAVTARLAVATFRRVGDVGVRAAGFCGAEVEGAGIGVVAACHGFHGTVAGQIT